MKKLAITLLTILLALTACGTKENANETEDLNTIEIKHDLGVTQTPINPKRVVVFDLGVLETLDTLSIDVIGLPQDDLSQSLKKYQADDYVNVGSLFEPNFEVLYELEPDLILISGRAADHYDELSKLAPTLHLASKHDDFLNSVFNIWDTIGQIFPDKAATITEKIESVQGQVEVTAKQYDESDLKALVLMVSGDDLSVFGHKSRYGMVYDDFHVKAADPNIEESNHGQNIGFEYLLEVNPDLLFVLDRGQIVGSEQAASDFLDNDMVNQTSAAKNQKIIYLDTESWYLTTTGILSIEKMIDEVKAAITP